MTKLKMTLTARRKRELREVQEINKLHRDCLFIFAKELHKKYIDCLTNMKKLNDLDDKIDRLLRTGKYGTAQRGHNTEELK